METTLLKRICDVLDKVHWKAEFWFAILNTFFVFLISYKYFVLLHSEASALHPVYSVVAFFCHFVCLTLLLLGGVFFQLYFFTRKYLLAKWVTIVLATIALIILIIDAYVFSLYRFHLNSYVLTQVFGPASGQVFEFTVGQYIAVAVVLLLLLTIEMFVFKLAEKLANSVPFKYVGCILLSIIFLFLSVQSYRLYELYKSPQSIIAIERHFPAALPLYPVLKLSDGSTLRLNVSNNQYTYPKQPLSVSPTGKNLVIIAFDSWRYTTMDSLCTPNIYSFAKKAVTFDQHYSGSNGTKSGVFSLFYGLSGSYFNDFDKQSIEPVLMQTMRDNGYDVRLFPSASLRNPPLDKTVFLSYSNQCDPAGGMNAWQRDVYLANNFMTYLTERDTTKPFMSFLFFDSLHSMIKPDDYKGPFQPSWTYAKYEQLGKGVDPTEFLNLYKNMVYYLDSLAGLVLSELESKGLLENTIVVITGDHAQEFDDNHHSFWGHNGNFSDAQIRVPMIYYNPDSEATTYHHWTAHYDVVPTLMRDMFNVTNPVSDYSIGKYLQDTTERDFLVVDSYIGIGMIDSKRNITNLFYDETYQITDASLNEDFHAEVDVELYRKVQDQLKMFQR